MELETLEARVQMDAASAWTLGYGSPVSSAVVGGVPVVAGVNTTGDVVVMRAPQSGTAWSGARAQFPSGVQDHSVSRLFLYSDPRDGRAYLMVIAGSNAASTAVYWGQVAAGSAVISLVNLGAAIAPSRPAINFNSALFTTRDRRVVLAGTDTSGDLVIYYQNGSAAPSATSNWTRDNLTRGHIIPGGQIFTPVLGFESLTALSTNWGANTIVYLERHRARAGRVVGARHDPLAHR